MFDEREYYLSSFLKSIYLNVLEVCMNIMFDERELFG